MNMQAEENIEFTDGDKRGIFQEKFSKRVDEEIKQLIDECNYCLYERAKPSNCGNGNFRIDQQGDFKKDGRRYYNLQIQRNEQKGNSTVAAILVQDCKPEIPVEYFKKAFLRSYEGRIKVWVNRK